MAKRRTNPKPKGNFPTGEQAAVTRFIAAPTIEDIPVDDGSVNSALIEAVQHRYGVRLVAVTSGAVTGMVNILDPECDWFDDKVISPGSDPEKGEMLAVRYYVRPIPVDNGPWNAIPKCKTRDAFVRVLHEQIKSITIEDEPSS